MGLDIRKIARSPKFFRDVLKIDTGDARSRPFHEVIEPWQRKDFEVLDASWQRAVGQKAPENARFFRGGYFERPRGHSKTSDIAVAATWALAFSKRRIQGLAASGDKDQAAILKDAIGRLVYSNPWLEDMIDIQRDRVMNTRTGSKLQILSSDAFSSYGHLPDFIVADELSHWSSDDLWTTLASSTAKRPNCLMVIITNAGFVGTWQHSLRHELSSRETWHFSALDRPMASWITEEALEEQRTLLPRHDYLRLWFNQWTAKSGEALDPSDIAAAFAAGLPVIGTRDPDYEYMGGLDLGVTQDHSSLVVLGKHVRTGRVRLARSWNWAPPVGGKVDLDDVERTCLFAHREYKLCGLIADPVQAEQMIQRLEKVGVNCDARHQRSRQHIEQAQAFLEVFAGRNIDLPHDDSLEEQIRSVQVKSQQYGVRLVVPRTKGKGHADKFTAMVLALAGLRQFEMAGLVAIQLDTAQVECQDPEIWRQQIESHSAVREGSRKPVTAGTLDKAMRELRAYEASVGWDLSSARTNIRLLGQRFPNTMVSERAEKILSRL